jgi:hypothetical protein
MLAPSVLERRPEITEANCALSGLLGHTLEPGRPLAATVKLMFQHCGAIPLEDGSGNITPFDGFAIVPLNHAATLAGLRDRLDEARNTLQRLKQLAPDVRSQAKYQRSLGWLNAIRTKFVGTFRNRLSG